MALKLKQPKTARSNPIQVVEFTETGGLLCPIRAWKEWRKGRKSQLLGGRPLFTWKDGKLITMLLAALLPDAEVNMTTRAFRPTLRVVAYISH